MERLRSSDPARVAGHRLLGRLGAGGMGVVYLARTATGSLVALKVLAAEYAEDEGFRERFRREVEVARRVGSPWAVPLVDADVDAQAPWLATAYVPGPSLAEAVAAHGPFTEYGLRVLGGRLALALGEVHRAGLVHRDLKPGNVLLAPDGPRLIDFGIARAPEDTALTATGLVVGTPGYLSPEQAEGRGGPAIGAPSDVFSLGCVLAFASTGRPPFGTGALDALLYRAVHDPADLDGVPATLTALLSRCLEKEPARRPRVEEVARELLPEEEAVGAPAREAGAARALPPEDTAVRGSSPDEKASVRALSPVGSAGPANAEAGETGPQDGEAEEAGPRDAEARESDPQDTEAAEAGARRGEAGESGARDGGVAVGDALPGGAAEAPADAVPYTGGEAASSDGPVDAPDGGAGPTRGPSDGLSQEPSRISASAGVSARSTDGLDGTADGPVGTSADAPGSWLPEEVVRLIARRSTEALALPDIERTEVSAGRAEAEAEAAANGDSPSGTSPRPSGAEDDTASPASGAGDTLATTAGAPDAPSRRRLLLAGAGAVLAAGGGATWWALGRDGASGGGKPAAASRRPAYTVALHGDLSGDQRVTGRAQENGVRLAVAEFNARGDAPFQVAVRAVDDSGDPAESSRISKRLADDPAVLAVVGPTTDATAQSALAAYDAGLLPVIAVSPGAIGLAVQGFRSFLYARLPDPVLAVYIDPVLRGTRPRRVGVVVDRASDTYGGEIGSSLSAQLHTAGQPYIPRVVSAMRSGFGDTVDDLLAADSDAFAFAGLPDRGASFARTLRERGFSGVRASGPALLDQGFLSAAREAADGWTIVAPVVDATRVPAAKAFVDAYRQRWKTAPPRYAAEAYDVTGMVLKTLAELPAKKRTREELLAGLRAAEYQGITRKYAFQKNGLPVIDGTGGFVWHVEDGAFVYGGPAPLQA
ncbi:ABC transporter substrate-binding protein [Streptomyces sp. NPDC012510]|uniref:protein kinase domain-containing protein n=1 Tax=Streptomyces sp. NPDC012510 TaxID=3364838 RepID=UPI0036E2ED38